MAGLAGGGGTRRDGWRDATRLARGDATMGAEIAASNAEAIAVVMRGYRDRIDEWIEPARGAGRP